VAIRGETVRWYLRIAPCRPVTTSAHYQSQLRDRPDLPGTPSGARARLQCAQHLNYPPLEELWAKQQSIDEWYVHWSDDSTEESLVERVRFTFVGGGDGLMTREQMLMHIVRHTSYHRGWVAEMFNQVPAKPPTADLTVFLRDVPLDLA
jgi:hypothetical protein